MAKKFYRTFALAVAGMLCLLNTISAQTGTAKTEMKKNTQARPVAVKPKQISTKQAITKNKAASKKKDARRSKKKGERQARAFVTLSRLILGDVIISNKSAETGTRAFDQPLLDRSILGAKARYRPVLTVGDLYTPGVITGLESDHILGTYSGSKELQVTDSDSISKGSSAPFAYKYKMDHMALNAGVAWINDIADSNGIAKTLKEAGVDRTFSKVSGVNLNLGASYQTFSLSGGYIRALDSFAPAQLSPDGNETKSSAWNSELAYTTELLRKETVLAVGYQKSLESLQLYLPEQRYITKASMVVLDGTTLSLEYYLGKDNSVKEGGADAESYGITTRIGLEF